ncbi:MAG: DUF177 domain-containing protein [Firmicutes bacterium]|nr:DUF177 domain-containing protein [Bacillota bacterium]
MIELGKLGAEGLRVEGREAVVPLEGQDALRDLSWKLFLLPSDGDVFMDVKGHARWDCTCSRCLEPIEQELQVHSQFLGSKDADLVARGSHTLGSQDLDVIFLPETVLDEVGLVREQFLLQLSPHPLCKEDCQGLCPRCGKNWNKGRCQCVLDPQPEPSALAKALSGLKLNLETPAGKTSDLES